MNALSGPRRAGRAVGTRAVPEDKPAEPVTPSEPSAAEPEASEPVAVLVAEPEAEAAVDTPEPEEIKYDLKVEGQRFAVAQGQLPAVAGASLGLFLRAGTGALVQGYTPALTETDETKYTLQNVGGRMLEETSPAIASFKRPEKPIAIYEFDACPFCKKVREMVCFLDLDVLFYPCPQGGPNFRPEAVAKGGKSRFPYMEDPNTGAAMYESDDIIKYLADTYGDGTVPLALRLGPATAITAGLSGIGRIGKGGRYSPSTLPAEPLVLWAYEPSPFCRVVRERLVELEIPHLFRSTSRGSAKRQEMFDKYGKFQAPLLEDPNTKTALFESADIIQYLNDTYATSA